MMIDYFENDFENSERPEPNEDAIRRMEDRPRFDLHEAIEYDLAYINRILNHETLDRADRYNIADVVGSIAYHYLEHNDHDKSWDDFQREVLGDEFVDNLLRRWLQRIGNKLAKKWKCPELYNPEGIFMMMPEEDDE